MDVRYPPVGTVEEDDAECDTDEDGYRIVSRRFYTRKYEAGETRGEHDTRGKSEHRVERLLRRVTPDEHDKCAEKVEKCDDKTRCKSQQQGVIADESDERLGCHLLAKGLSPTRGYRSW
jgi:hypothetical protein